MDVVWIDYFKAIEEIFDAACRVEESLLWNFS